MEGGGGEKFKTARRGEQTVVHSELWGTKALRRACQPPGLPRSQCSLQPGGVSVLLSIVLLSFISFLPLSPQKVHENCPGSLQIQGVARLRCSSERCSCYSLTQAALLEKFIKIMSLCRRCFHYFSEKCAHVPFY